MRRIFTYYFIAIALMIASFNSYGQGCTGGTFTPEQTYDFGTLAGGAMGFTGDFTRVNNTGGQLSTTVGATSPTIKTLISPTLIGPADLTTNIQFSFVLGGNASVTGYSVSVLYFNGTDFVPLALCVATTTPLSNGTNSFTIPNQVVLQGQSLKISITFYVTGNINNTVTVDNYSTNLQESLVPLPVKFSSLDAKAINNSVSLKWTVGSEINVNGYEIEKSSDGRNFSKIGFVSATGQSSYSFIDSKASSIAYYRIKSVDGDGKYTYSTVTLVKAGKSMIVLKAFPSPFTNSVTVQHATANGSSLISISSEDGRLIKTVIPIAGTQQTDINLSTAAPGLYLIRFAAGNKDVQTLKILKQQ